MSDTRTTDAPEPANGDWDCTPDDDPAHEAEMYRLVCEMDAVNASGTRYAAAEVTR